MDRGGRRMAGAGLSRRGGQSGGAALFDPLTLTGLTVWSYGDDPGIGFGTFSWPNYGTANNFVNTTSGTKPVPGVLFGRQTVDFDGTDDTCATGVLQTVLGNPVTQYWGLIVVEAHVAAGAPTANTYDNEAILADGSGFWCVNRSSSGWGLSHYDGADKHTGWASGPATGRTLVEFWWDGTTGYCRVDDGTPASAVMGAPSTIVAATRMARNWKTTYFNGEVGEVVIATTIPSAADIAACRNRMRSRWGVTV